jgi:hypothetical protein
LVEGRDAKGWVWLKDPADKGAKVKLKESREQKLEPQRASTGTQVADHDSFTLWDHPTGSDMYLHVKTLLENTWVKSQEYALDTDWPVVVHEIRHPDLQTRYDQYRSALHDSTSEKLLFHGCAPAYVLTIPAEGFLKKYWTSSAGSWQRFQPGFYFALQSSKSHDYPLPEMRALSKGKHTRHMLLCKVASGREYPTEVNMDGRDGQNKVMPPQGYDSVHGKVSTGALNFAELVVYEEAAVQPYAIVEYGFIKK